MHIFDYPSAKAFCTEVFRSDPWEWRRENGLQFIHEMSLYELEQRRATEANPYSRRSECPLRHTSIDDEERNREHLPSYKTPFRTAY